MMIYMQSFDVLTSETESKRENTKYMTWICHEGTTHYTTLSLWYLTLTASWTNYSYEMLFVSFLCSFMLIYSRFQFTQVIQQYNNKMTHFVLRNSILINPWAPKWFDKGNTIGAGRLPMALTVYFIAEWKLEFLKSF